MNDLTVSNIERQNVLNNNYALQAIQENLDVNGLRFHDQLLFTTKMVADSYGVDERTIKRYVQEHGDELRANGYFLMVTLMSLTKSVSRCIHISGIPHGDTPG